MNEKIKRVVTGMGMLVFCLVITVLFLQGVLNAEASTDTNHDQCKALVKEMDVADYRSGDEFTAPEEDGYVFSGWYKEETCENPLSKSTKEGKAWAKFVPQEILSVKAQISANLLNGDTTNDEKASIRFVTTVDSLQYREIGFDITINGKTARRSSNLVYEILYAVGASGGEPLKYTPQEEFCSLSLYFKAWTFTNIPKAAYETEITVQPVWVTLDGTTVYGERAIKTVRQGIDSEGNSPVARIQETGTEYTTLSAAVQDANDRSSATIVLLADAEIDSSLTISGNVTITDDGTARTITRSSSWIKSTTSPTYNRMFYIAENAVLILSGSSGSDDTITLTLDGGGTSRATSQIVAVGGVAASTAVFTLNAGVRLTNNYNTSDGGAVVVYGVMNMKGGIIDKCKAVGTGGAINLRNPNSDDYIGKYGVMNMSGGTIAGNTTTDVADGAGGVNVSARCTLVMTGGTIADNLSPDSVGVNSVRLGYHTSVLKMGGEAYIDCICFANNSSSVELTGNLTTEKKITLFYYASLPVGGEVIKAGLYTLSNYSKFELSKQMLPCSLVCNKLLGPATLQGEVTGLTEVKVTDADLVYTYSDANKSCNVQSACSDGKYVYLAIERPVYENGVYQYGDGKIIKVDPKTWTTVKESDWLRTNHNNDLTYNSQTKELLVTHCYDDVTTTDADERYTVTAVDPVTLEAKGNYTVLNKNISSGGIYALDYNAGKNLYVAGISGYRFAILNSDRSLNTVFTGVTSYIKQSIYTNGTTIYANSWDSQNHRNYISSYDWSGNYAGGYYINGLSIEGEGIFQHDGQFYMVCVPQGKGGAVVYRLNGVVGPGLDINPGGEVGDNIDWGDIGKW